MLSNCLRMIKINRKMLSYDKLRVKNITLTLVDLLVLLCEQSFCGLTYTKWQCSPSIT